MNYGTVAINEWPALGFIIPTMPWGGYPGNKDSDIQSGQGYVHNALFFESPLKGVLYSKFKLPLIDFCQTSSCNGFIASFGLKSPQQSGL